MFLIIKCIDFPKNQLRDWVKLKKNTSLLVRKSIILSLLLMRNILRAEFSHVCPLHFHGASILVEQSQQ